MAFGSTLCKADTWLKQKKIKKFEMLVRVSAGLSSMTQNCINIYVSMNTHVLEIKISLLKSWTINGDGPGGPWALSNFQESAYKKRKGEFSPIGQQAYTFLKSLNSVEVIQLWTPQAPPWVSFPHAPPVLGFPICTQSDEGSVAEVTIGANISTCRWFGPFGHISLK